MSQKITSLEQEIERLSDGADLENVSSIFKISFPPIFLQLEKFCNFNMWVSPSPQYLPLKLRREKQHLESELERAERESATYVTEVREVRAFQSVLWTPVLSWQAVHPPPPPPTQSFTSCFLFTRGRRMPHDTGIASQDNGHYIRYTCWNAC